MEMKKYQTPEIEVFEMKYQKPLLDVSGETAGGGGHGHAPEFEIEE